MHPVRQDESQGVAPEGALHATDVLHRVAAQVDLDLEVLVAMWRCLGGAAALVADVESISSLRCCMT